MAVDTERLPEDPKALQQMVLDLMAQLDHEFSERSKIEALLRELYDAERNRESEQLPDEQLALFAALWQKRRTEREAENPAGDEDDDDGQPGEPGANTTWAQRSAAAIKHCPDSLEDDGIVHDLAQEEKRLCDGIRICGLLARRPVNAMVRPASLTVIEEACLKISLCVRGEDCRQPGAAQFEDH